MTAAITTLVLERAGRLPMNEAAFLEFYARTAGPLMGYLTRLTGDASAAEDALQESYLRLLGAARVPEDDDHRRHYLFRIATNLVRDRFRRAKHATLVPLDERQAATGAPACGDEAGVWTAMRQLSPRDRELLVLAYVEGFTHAEIAAITGLMPASLKPLLFRARRRLARAFEQRSGASS
jgi:RNA polymerase sigma-70 factor, ECF subfamily